METLLLPVKGFIFWPMPLAIEQWGFSRVPHILWHGPSFYNGHFQGLVNRTCHRALVSWAVTTCFKDQGMSRLGFEHPTPSLRGERFIRLCLHRGGLSYVLLWKWSYQNNGVQIVKEGFWQGHFSAIKGLEWKFDIY